MQIRAGLTNLRSAGKECFLTVVCTSSIASPIPTAKPVAAEFRRGYFEGDGSISFSGAKMIELSCISKSERLISQLQTLLLRFGIVGTKRFDSYRATHKLYIRWMRQYVTFRDAIGFVSHNKKTKLSTAIARLDRKS